MELIKLNSVGSVYNPKNKMVYAMNNDGTPDLDNNTLLKECDEEWFNRLSKQDLKKLKNVQ